jgi:hypothetical protein
MLLTNQRDVEQKQREDRAGISVPEPTMKQTPRSASGIDTELAED